MDDNETTKCTEENYALSLEKCLEVKASACSKFLQSSESLLHNMLEYEQKKCTLESFLHINNKKSEKLNVLSILKKNIENVIRNMDNILEMNHCASLIKTYMQNKEYFKSAVLVNRYMKMDRRFVNEVLGENVSFTSLTNVKEQLITIYTDYYTEIYEKMDKVNENSNGTKYDEIFSVFPLIGMFREGLDYYSDFIVRKLKLSASEVYKEFSGSNLTLQNFHTSLFRILKLYATQIESSFTFISINYDIEECMSFVKNIHTKCLNKDLKMMDEIINNQFDIEHITIVCKKRVNANTENNLQDHSSNFVSELYEKRDLILDFIIVLISCFTSYTNCIKKLFMKNKAYFSNINFDQESNAIQENFSKQASSIRRSPASLQRFSKFIEAFIKTERSELIIKKYAEFYLDLSFSTISLSFAKAIKLDKVESDIKYPTIVDDIFYIFYSFVEKGNSAFYEYINYKTINWMQKFLLDQYTKYIERLTNRTNYDFFLYDLRDWIESVSKSDYTANKSYQFFVGLNLIQCSISSLELMIDKFNSILFQSDFIYSEHEKVKAALHSLIKVKGVWKFYIDGKIDSLIEHGLLKLLKEKMDDLFFKYNYKIEQNEYNQVDCVERKKDVASLLRSMNAILQVALNNENLDKVYQKLSQALANLLVSLIIKIQMTKYGAMSLHTIVHMIIVDFNNIAGHSSTNNFDSVISILDVQIKDFNDLKHNKTMDLLQLDISKENLVLVVSNRVDVSKESKNYLFKLLS